MYLQEFAYEVARLMPKVGVPKGTKGKEVVIFIRDCYLKQMTAQETADAILLKFGSTNKGIQ